MKKYPLLMVSEFVDYVSNLMDEHPHEDYYWIFAALCNDESSTDEELKLNLLNDNVHPVLVKELVELREYFWNFRYTKDYFWNPEYK